MSLESSLIVATGVAIDQKSMRDCLESLIRKTTSDASIYDDLLQEAMVHLWLTESRRPGQTPSWYLQSCKFHLQHYLSAGRSVDSTKRRSGQLHFAHDSDQEDGVPEQADAGNSVITSVSARELMSLLSPHLSSQENAVLNCLADGLGAREIGRELNMSHTMVIKHRRRIASLLVRLEKLDELDGAAAPLNGNGHARVEKVPARNHKRLETSPAQVQEAEVNCRKAA